MVCYHERLTFNGTQRCIEPGGRSSGEVDVIEARGLDQRAKNRSVLAAPVRAAEQPSLAAERQAAARLIDRVVGWELATVVAEICERLLTPKAWLRQRHG